jgi:DNA-binding CsgD family transcriptional regulator
MSTGLALISQNRQGQIREFSLAKDKLLLGRSTQCDLFVLDPTISRKHAEITVHGIDVTVTDLGSRNGTYVDGNRIGSSVVRQGQIVTFGRLDFVLAGPLTENASIEAEALTASCRDDNHANAALQALSSAQRKVFDLALNGLPEKKMASRLKISCLTVHTHVRAVYRLLGVHSRAELLARFLPGATIAPHNHVTEQQG